MLPFSKYYVCLLLLSLLEFFKGEILLIQNVMPDQTYINGFTKIQIRSIQNITGSCCKFNYQGESIIQKGQLINSTSLECITPPFSQITVQQINQQITLQANVSILANCNQTQESNNILINYNYDPVMLSQEQGLQYIVLNKTQKYSQVQIGFSYLPNISILTFFEDEQGKNKLQYIRNGNVVQFFFDNSLVNDGIDIKQIYYSYDDQNIFNLQTIVIFIPQLSIESIIPSFFLINYSSIARVYIKNHINDSLFQDSLQFIIGEQILEHKYVGLNMYQIYFQNNLPQQKQISKLQLVLNNSILDEYNISFVQKPSLNIINQTSLVTIYGIDQKSITLQGDDIGLLNQHINFVINKFSFKAQYINDTAVLVNFPINNIETSVLDLYITLDNYTLILMDNIKIKYYGKCPLGYYCTKGELSKCLPGFFCPFADLISPLQCPPGTYQNEEGQSMCKDCPAGTICLQPGLTQPINCSQINNGVLCNKEKIKYMSELNKCPRGSFCENGTQSLCPDGYKCPSFTSSRVKQEFSLIQCKENIFCSGNYSETSSFLKYSLHCPEGYYCKYGLKIKCPKGYFCQPHLHQPQQCPPGFYNPEEGQKTCKICPLGSYCPLPGMDSFFQCPLGRVCSFAGLGSPPIYCPKGLVCQQPTITLDINTMIQSKSIKCPLGGFCIEGTAYYQLSEYKVMYPQKCLPASFCDKEGLESADERICQIGYYCPEKQNIQLMTEEGFYSNSLGQSSQMPCPEGYYSNTQKAKTCQLCPPGKYCPSKNMIQPLGCPAGEYRNEDDDPTSCQKCPIGTWSNKTNSTSIKDCEPCPEKLVCQIEGMNSLDQAEICPEGYVCPLKTTLYSYLNNPCPQGFWCGKGIANETGYRICDASYYCQERTKESQRYSNSCPKNFFCPPGSFAEFNEAGEVIAIKQANYTVMLQSLKVSDPDYYNSFMQNFSQLCQKESQLITQYLQQTGLNHICPEGTVSQPRSSCLSDCISEGSSTPLVTINMISNQIVDTLNESRRILVDDGLIIDPINNNNQTDKSKSTQVGQDYFVIPSNYICYLIFNFESFYQELIYKSHYFIQLQTIGGQNLALPPLLDISNFNSQDDPIQFQKLSLRVWNYNSVEMKLKALININHGLYKEFANKFLNTFKYEIQGPERAQAGTSNLFTIILSQSQFNLYNLPYNLPAYPFYSVNMLNKEYINQTLLNQTLEKEPFDSTYWSLNQTTAVAISWLPFFSKCEGYDKYMVFYDIIQNPRCRLIEEDLTQVVQSLPTTGIFPIADSCNYDIKCYFEETNSQKLSEYKWFNVKEDRVLYYMIKNPMEINELILHSEDQEYTNLIQDGSDDLIPVTFTPVNPITNALPSVITLSVKYYQVSQSAKRLNKIDIILENYDKDLINQDFPSYKLIIDFQPNSYFELINSFQFDLPIYIIIFIFLGIATVLIMLVIWGILRVIFKKLIKLKYREALISEFLPALQGTFYALVPISLVILYVYIFSYDSFISSISWDYDEIQESSDFTLNVKRGRVGLFLLMSSSLLLWFGIQKLIPIPNKEQEKTIVSNLKKENQHKQNQIESEVPNSSQLSQQEFDSHSISSSEENEINIHNDQSISKDSNINSRNKKINNKFSDTPSKNSNDSFQSENNKSSNKSMNSEKENVEEQYQLTATLRKKRGFYFVICLLESVILLPLLQISFLTSYGSYSIYLVILFMLADIVLTVLLMSFLINEALLIAPILGAFELIQFVMVIGNDTFSTFVISFMIRVFLNVIFRIFLDPILRTFVKNFQQNWNKFKMWLVKKNERFSQFLTIKEQDGGTHETLRMYLGMNIDLQETQGLENLILVLMSYTTRSKSIYLRPLLIIFIRLFDVQTQIPQLYKISKSSLDFYIVFSVIFIVPLIVIDMFIVNSIELVHGFKLLDFLSYCRHRFVNRTTKWLGSNFQLDKSMSISFRSVDNMCFSCQYYFVITIIIVSVSFMTLSLQIMTRQKYQPFGDSGITYILLLTVFTMYFSQFLMAKFADVIDLWGIKQHEVKKPLALIDEFLTSSFDKNSNSMLHTELMRNHFIQTNKEWLIENLHQVIIKEDFEKNDEYLLKVYQYLLNDQEKENKLKKREYLQQQKNNLFNNQIKSLKDSSRIDIESQFEQFISEEPALRVQKNSYDISIALVQFWYYQAKHIMFMKSFIKDVKENKLKFFCQECHDDQNLRVVEKIQFTEVLKKFRIRYAGLPFDKDKWRKYYEKSQKFITWCEDCELSNLLQKSKKQKETEVQEKKEELAHIMANHSKLLSCQNTKRDIIPHKNDQTQNQIAPNAGRNLTHPQNILKMIMSKWLFEARARMLHMNSKGFLDIIEIKSIDDSY